MKQLLFILACLVLFLCGCEKKQAQPPAEPAPQVQDQVQAQPPVPPQATASLLHEPIEATLVEHPAQALPLWRNFRANQPTLVFLSREPFLQPIPAGLRAEANDLILNGSPAEIIEKTDFANPAPLLLPMMALSSALSTQLFSEVVWVFPSTVPRDRLDGEQLRQQLLDYGAIDAAEAQTLTLADGVFSGRVRGAPFRAMPLDALPPLEGPVVLHIDLGYFQPLYQGEISTRLYPLLFDTLRKLRKSDWDSSAVSISYSNLNGDLPLAIRFIGPTLVSLLGNPQMLDEPLPLNWQRRANALYMASLFKNQEILELYQKVDADLPENAAAKYDLYQIYRELKEGSKALASLEQAVALDPGYALEYFKLTAVAKEKGRPDQSLRMLRLAQQALPDNPYISQQMAAQLIELNHSEQALQILDKLLELPWSKLYYPDMPERLNSMSADARQAQQAAEKEDGTKLRTGQPEP